MSEQTQPITGVVITLNESKNIVECIQSLQQVCSEIVIVDSNSSDNTVELATSLGATVVSQSYLGDGFQKNVGLEHTENRWILSLDADERLTDEMVASIKSLDLGATSHDAFAFRRRNYIGSRWIKQCGWYPDFCIRLYNKDKTRFSEVKQHASVQAKNPQKLKVDIIHFSFDNIGQLFAKPGRNFSGRAAKILYQKGKKAHSFSPFIHGLSAFIRQYIVKRGFLGGVDGMTVALSASISSYLKYAKLLEYQRDPKVLENENFDKVW
jgi:glycosyltransferase involved in cell wall biosynthesis